MKKLITVFLVLGLLLMISDNAFGYTTGASYSWNPGDPGYNAAATIHAGTIPTSLIPVMGDFLGRSSTNPNAIGYGDSGVSVGWDDTWVSGVGNPNTNGDNLDGLWAQIYSDGGWWDLKAAYSQVAVMTSQDHSPYLAEGLEYRIYGTNTLWTGALSPQAIVTDVYLDGWRTHKAAEDTNGNKWLSDDISAVLSLGGSYRYIKLVSWDVYGSLNEPEVDAVAGVVPVPGAFLLGSIGLAFACRKLRRRKEL